MKNKFFYALALSATLSLAQEKTPLIFNPFPITNSWQTFFDAAFEFPQQLERARQKNLPVVLHIPKNVHGFSPLEDGMEWLEGMRVALTWATIYQQIHQVEVRFVEEDNVAHPNKSMLVQAESVQPSIYRAVKIFLITGAAGFIGSHLCKALLNEGHRVIGVDNLLCSNGENVQPLLSNNNFVFYQHDVTQPLAIDEPVDCIVHLASVPSPAFYYRLPHETMNVGLLGTRNMLELARKKSARFLFSSTSEVYGDPAFSPQDEAYAGNVDPRGPRAQYDQSKRGAETLIKYYFEQYQVDVRIARIFNTYGPHMNLDDGRVVTNFIQALLNQKPMRLYGGGQQTRSFAYVTDTVNGLLKLIHLELAPATPIKERVVNIGNDGEFTIAQLAQLLNALAPDYGLQPTAITAVKAVDLTDPKQRQPDLARAKKLLCYTPTVLLEEGLAKTLSYFVEKEKIF